jgi:hypothetical protein
MVEALRRELAELGLDFTVEGRGRVALLVPRGGHVELAGSRGRVLALAIRHGFATAAVELPEDGVVAPLLRG